MQNTTSKKIQLTRVPKLYKESVGKEIAYQAIYRLALAGRFPAEQNNISNRWTVEVADLPEIFAALNGSV